MSNKMKSSGKKIPGNCKYWRFQGDHKEIGCQITGELCREDCDPDELDPKRFSRDRIDRQRTFPNYLKREHNG